MAIEVVIITGLSGSGMSSALKAFEDLGYFCVDNLPIKLIPTFVELCARSSGEIERAALVIDIRERRFLEDLPQIHQELRKGGASVKVLFLEADTETLQRRYSETRRPHPLMESGVLEAIEAERELLAPIRALADEVIDTTGHTLHSLRRYVTERFKRGRDNRMLIRVITFGFKHGIPPDVDLLFDVRFLPNPFFVPELKNLSGEDSEVVNFLLSKAEVQETISRFSDLLEFLLPKYQREGKSYVTIGVGCTGGRHRSVMVGKVLGERLSTNGFEAKVFHRDLDRT